MPDGERIGQNQPVLDGLVDRLFRGADKVRRREELGPEPSRLRPCSDRCTALPGGLGLTAKSEPTAKSHPSHTRSNKLTSSDGCLFAVGPGRID